MTIYMIMGDYLDKVLELLKDSQWHMIEEVKREIPLPEEKLGLIIDFLFEEEFIDKDDSALRITSKGLQFLELPV